MNLMFQITIKIYKNTFYSVAKCIFTDELTAYGWGHVSNMIAFSNFISFGYTIYKWIYLLIVLRKLENISQEHREKILKDILKK